MLRILHYCACNRDHARKPHLLAAATNEVYTQVTGRGHKRETFTRHFALDPLLNARWRFTSPLVSLGIFCLGTFALNLSLAMLVWRLSPSIPRLETFPWDLSLRNDHFQTASQQMHLWICCLRLYAWKRSSDIFRLGSFAWEFSLDISPVVHLRMKTFSLESFAWIISYGIFRWRAFA